MKIKYQLILFSFLSVGLLAASDVEAEWQDYADSDSELLSKKATLDRIKKIAYWLRGCHPRAQRVIARKKRQIRRLKNENTELQKKLQNLEPITTEEENYIKIFEALKKFLSENLGAVALPKGLSDPRGKNLDEQVAAIFHCAELERALNEEFYRQHLSASSESQDGSGDSTENRLKLARASLVAAFLRAEALRPEILRIE